MSRATEVFQPLQAGDPPVVGSYRLAARLGAGGMGRVYLAHTPGGRPVALKVVRPELADDMDFRRRFGREIRSARRVRGAYTAELIDADADAVPPWLATVYVPGPSLSQAVGESGPLPVPALLWLMAGVAEALQAIHAEGIVHRDLKPSNVLLAADGPRVIDFGIATAADGTSYTATGHAIGTPGYMAPEQASGSGVTPATDVFALGQTAAFAALGRPLYGDGPGVDVLYRIVHSEPDLSLLPETLRPLFARCLAADPAERATPAEVVEWCRHRLGADAGGGPDLWREISGPEVVVPPPVPDPTPMAPQALTGPQDPTTAWLPPAPEDRGSGRRRTALITTAALAGGALLVTALAWTVTDAWDRAGAQAGGGLSASAGQHGGTSSTGAKEPAPGSSGSPAGPGRGASSDSGDPSTLGGGGSGSGTGARGGGTAGGPPSSSASPREPQAEPYPLVYLDAKKSLAFKDPDSARKDGTGDIRFDCKKAGCELVSSTSSFVEVFGKPGATFDECRRLLGEGTYRSWSLTGAPNGSEFCVKGPSGDIGLFVITAKSTAVPDIAFLEGELTIWRDAA